ncbi:DUF421 domain-containing protein [uncultured Clostridium sp.]|uniref:DUF421 domain-containing protein n=1 Tax=uncultured Clostridium sp. TaxID=59620 RepID=UPI00262CF07A|nr:DUF421 domain-containing protein [uncultured Clostridium sp.]
MGNIYSLTIIKCIIGFLLALLLSKIIGRKIISKMNFVDLVMGVSMGSMIANAVIDKDSPIQSEIIALILFGALTIITSYISLKSIKARSIISSKPVILVKDGIILNNNLLKLRVSIDELMMKLREKGTFNLEEVQYAIMEGDGQISLLIKAEKKAITPYDMNIEVNSSGLLKDLIIDGILIEKNLVAEGLDFEWLKEYLNKNKIKDISEIFYAGIDSNKKIVISQKIKY